MRLRINKEIQKLSRSSKNVNYAEDHNDFVKLQKESSKSNRIHKSNKIVSSFSPPAVIPKISINSISTNNNSLNSNNFPVALSPKKNNFLQLNYVHRPKEASSLNKSGLNKSILNKSRMSIEGLHKRKSINSSIINAVNKPIIEHSSQTHLKVIQKELQFKLLDMSMAIENTANSDEDDNYFYNKKISESKPLKYELSSLKSDINSNRKKSVILGNSANFFNNFNSKGLKSLNKSHNKGVNSFKKNNIGFFNLTSFRNGQNNIKSFRRKSFNGGRSNAVMNKSYRNSLILSRSSINSHQRNSVIFNRVNMSVNSFTTNILQKIEFESKYRNLLKQKELYDSYEDEEVIEELEEEYFYINPETHKIFIFDTIILLSNLFCSVYYPLYIAQSECFCSYIPKLIRYILFFTDFIDIIDIKLSFFRAYYNYEFALIKKNEKIVKHYLKIYFISDLIAAIPVFSFCYLLCGMHRPSEYYCFTNGLDFKHNLLKMCLGLKIIKIFKVVNKKTNRGINYYYEIISESYTIEKTMTMILFLIMCILAFNLFICYHIFIGKQSYPNWILETNNQDTSFLKLYMISFYFLITTITSVGYGDITCASFTETIYQIIILTIGVIAYSWIVSTIGNYVKNETKAAIKYNNNISILEEIRVAYPKMPFKLYNKIQKHLESVSLQEEKFDTNLLVNNLPYTLKNQLMFIIYDNIIKRFIFFKECQNSDFIIRILTSLIPNSAKKGAFIIHEGELIDNIIFVKQGRLSLVASIDLEDPLMSIDNYLGKTFEDINDKMNTNIDNSVSMNNSVHNIGLKMERAQTQITTLLKGNDLNENSNIEGEIGKCDFEGDEFDVDNYQFLNILDILKNEHYGEVFMFLQKPSPLSLRVKSKYSELFLLRKQEVMQISKAYPNVWKKIYYKSYHNMKSLKRLTKRIIIQYCRNNGLKSESDQDLDFMKSDNLLSTLGIKRNEKKIKFNLDGNNLSNNNLPQSPKYPKKPCLKIKNESVNSNITNLDEEITKKKNSLKDQQIMQPDNNKGFIIQINGVKMKRTNTLANLIRKANSNSINIKNIKNNISDYPNISNFIRMKTVKIKSKMIPKNSGDCESTSTFKKKKSNFITNSTKLLKKQESNKKDNDYNSTKTLKKQLTNLNNEEPNPFGQMYSNVAVRSNSIHNKKFGKKDSDDFFSVFKVNDPNVNDTKIMYNSKMKNIIQEQLNKSNDDDNENPKTIKNLSKQLMKKIQRKILKRRKRKKLYKTLISKITENLMKINPNFNLNLNLNSSVNNSFIIAPKSDNNIQSGIVAQNNSIIIHDNCITSDKPELNDGMNYVKEQELLIIPESAEFDSDYSSSKNSKISKESSSTSVNQKKKVELSISQNTNFSFSSIYDNINKISEGHYSKDVNLRKSVIKLIGIYIKEKSIKLKNDSFSFNKETSNKLVTISEIISKDNKEKEKNKKVNSNNTETTPTKNKNQKDKDKIKDNGKNKEKEKDKNKEEDKEKEKEKEKEKDVWAFLDENDEDENEYKYFKTKKENSKKDYSKTPKPKNSKKLINFTSAAKNESKFKKDETHFLFDNKDQPKKNPKKKRPKKCITLINPKQIKKQIEKNEKDLSDRDNADVKSSSLDLSLHDNFKQQENYIKNYYKTYKAKEKDLNKEEDNK